MKDLQDKETAERVWGRLLQEWDKLDDDDPPTWRKSCGMITFFITHLNEDNVSDFSFAIHGGDDEVILEQKLGALNFEDAADQSDALIAEFLSIGAGVLKTDEIRIKHAFPIHLRDKNGETVGHQYEVICAVGIDGILYMKDYNGNWCEQNMRLTPSPTVQ